VHTVVFQDGSGGVHNSGSFSHERLGFNSRAIPVGHVAHRMPMVFL